MHLADKIAHPSQLLFTRLDQHVDALTQHVQVLVRDECRNLDQRVAFQVQPGHLAVNPHQFIAHRSRVLPKPCTVHSKNRSRCVESAVKRF